MATEPALTLEAYLDKVAADNDLTTIAVGRMKVGDRIVSKATVHYDGFARDGIGCSSDHSSTTIRDAIERALVSAVQNRTPQAAQVDSVPMMAEAA